MTTSSLSPAKKVKAMRCRRSMAAETALLPRWIKWWMIISTVLCTLDVLYTMLRPMTLRQGALGAVYELWNIYSDVDLRYADPKDLVTMATGRLMLIEIAMNIAAIVLERMKSRHAILTTFTTSAFVLWKTLLYMALYIRTPPGTFDYITPGTAFWKEVLVFWIADGIWVAVPFAVMVQLWNRLALSEYQAVGTEKTSSMPKLSQ